MPILSTIEPANAQKSPAISKRYFLSILNIIPINNIFLIYSISQFSFNYSLFRSKFNVNIPIIVDFSSFNPFFKDKLQLMIV